MAADDIEAIANRFFAAVEAGDLDTITAMYHPNVRVWHVRDEADTDIAQSRELLGLFFARVPQRRYEIISRHAFGSGFVQEHVVHGVTADGGEMRMRVCFLCWLDESGRITRIAEYYNAGQSPLKDVAQHHSPLTAEG